MDKAFKKWWESYRLGLKHGESVRLQDLAERAYLAGWVLAKREDVRTNQ